MKTSDKCSQASYVLVTVGVYALSAVMAYGSQFVYPCCTVYIYYGTFGYAYLGQGFNYSDHFVDLPLNSLTTLVMAVCYFAIFVSVRRAGRMVDGQKRGLNAKRQDVRIAAQFSVIGSVLACECSFILRRSTSMSSSMLWVQNASESFQKDRFRF